MHIVENSVYLSQSEALEMISKLALAIKNTPEGYASYPLTLPCIRFRSSDKQNCPSTINFIIDIP